MIPMRLTAYCGPSQSCQLPIQRHPSEDIRRLEKKKKASFGRREDPYRALVTALYAKNVFVGFSMAQQFCSARGPT